jgi:hypothetical protein
MFYRSAVLSFSRSAEVQHGQRNQQPLRADLAAQSAALRRETEMLSAQAIALHTQASRIQTLVQRRDADEETITHLKTYLEQFHASLDGLATTTRQLTEAAKRLGRMAE